WPEREEVLRALGRAAIPSRGFDVILDVPRAHEDALRKVLTSFPGTAAVANVDSVNVQPALASKGAGLRDAQRALGVPRAATIAVGDGENDLAMFGEAGLAVAVANATAAARAAARLQLSLPNGAGVAQLIEDVLAGRV
ncbi:MAG TPA: HAD hydrolase family protein, partial [Candidatus Thermoplasmatota archaeon]|nr:HAD hydrolase family protein [Candidatus Thermoplasmatota archaeon]